MQKLIMPFDKQMMLCGYKNAEYKKHWGYAHYGVDISTIQGGASDNHIMYASGDGTVVAAGKDNKLGYGIAILYKDCYNHKTRKTCDLIARYMHMSKIYVKKGDTVTLGTPLADEGKEGTGDYHLHLEFDTDTNYPTYTPQVAGGTFWKKGTDSTVNPSYILYTDKSHTVVDPTYNPAWLNEEDMKIPKTTTTASSSTTSSTSSSATSSQIAALNKTISQLRSENTTLKNKVTQYETKLKNINSLAQQIVTNSK